ncbi:MAG: SPFH domain-containing protein [Gemmataceae bacterium]|nr:SPFH domain-containing protein [Gemmataceae bacterium]
MRENELKLSSGWGMLIAVIAAPFVFAALIAIQHPASIALAVALAVAWGVTLFGFIVVNPNESRVLQLFGKYVGTVKETGFFWANPLYWKTRVSLRVQTFETGVVESAAKTDAAGKIVESGQRHRQPSKVNDRDGTPIEIAAVVVYRVVDTVAATFAVDNYLDFVHMQADSALRNLASQYSYDSPDDQAHSLRGHTAEVAEKLQHEIQERVKSAGVEIIESRISYLAYAPEIAASMLQRQQAGAIIAARSKIVEGAVGMVEHALDLLAQKNVLTLDDERRAAMVSNLLIVLCGHSNPQPVMNTGTIYQ